MPPPPAAAASVPRCRPGPTPPRALQARPEAIRGSEEERARDHRQTWVKLLQQASHPRELRRVPTYYCTSISLRPSAAVPVPVPGGRISITTHETTFVMCSYPVERERVPRPAGRDLAHNAMQGAITVLIRALCGGYTGGATATLPASPAIGPLYHRPNRYTAHSNARGDGSVAQCASATDHMRACMRARQWQCKCPDNGCRPARIRRRAPSSVALARAVRGRLRAPIGHRMP